MLLVLLPSPRLAPYVQYFVFERLDGSITHIPATAAPILVIFQRGATCLCTGRQQTQLPPAFISGPSLRPRQSIALPDTALISVLFRPGEFHRFFPFDVSELTDRQIPLVDLMGAEAGRLVDRVRTATSSAHMCEIIEHFLLAEAHQRETGRHSLELMSVPHALLHAPLDSLAHALNLSKRQLQRRFIYEYGIPLRDFRRLARFALSLAGLLRGMSVRRNLGHFAQQAGYFDHAHFDHAFTDLCGLSPSEFLRRMSQRDPALWPFRFSRGDMDQLFPAVHDVASVQDTALISR